MIAHGSKIPIVLTLLSPCRTDLRRELLVKFIKRSMPTRVSLKDWMKSLIKDPDVIFLDGGVSTHLEHIIQKPFTHRCLWSSSLLLSTEGDMAIRKCHSDFYFSGSDIITTVTYQCSHAVCSGENFTLEDVDKMLRHGIDLACETREQYQFKIPQRQYFVVASIGCYGASLANGCEYTGDYGSMTVDDLIQFHARRFRVLSEYPSIIDGIAFETIPCLDEVEAIGHLLQRYGQQKQLAIWISLACKDGQSLNDGSSLKTALQVIDEFDQDGSRVHGIGLNCFHIKYLSSLLQILLGHIVEKKINRAIVFYPNSGEEWDATSSRWKEGTGLTEAATFAQRIVQDGLATIYNYLGCRECKIPIIIGGCCRTNPETIAAIRKQVELFIHQKKC